MADYNSNYTGQEIDEAVGKALSAVVSFNLSWDEDVEMGEHRVVLHASLAELIAAWQTGAVITARGHFELQNWSEDTYVIYTLIFIDSNYPYAVFLGHDPSMGGTDAGITFIPDASGETMSTDGGYVP